MGRPLRSVTYSCDGIGCDGTDHFMLLNNRTPSAGIYPTGPCVIKGFTLKSWFQSAGSYAVLGKTQPYGDHLGQTVYGDGQATITFGDDGFPWDAPQTLPVAAGDGTDQLHLHYLSAATEPAPDLEITVIYTLNSDPDLLA